MTASGSSDDTAQNATRAAARGTLATLLLRIVSFVCTQWTFRVLDPETLGKTSIQLELLLTTVLFISREGFRLALTRNISQDNWSVAWLSIPVSFLVAFVALLRHLYVASDADYRLAGILFCIACCIEGSAEPAVLYSLRKMSITLKASAEGIATVGKTVTTIIALQYLQNTWPVTAFGLAQVVYALIYATFLYWKTYKEIIRSGFPASFDPKTCQMVVVFAVQGVFKHFLTEGDRIVLTTLSGNYNQGVYAMGSAYGGLAARLLLQPLEENGRLLWSRLASSESSNRLQQSYTILVKLVLYIGFVFSCLAVNYTSILLNLLAGRKWGDNVEAVSVLSAFCVYTSFLAWNGMTEAFVYAVASTGQDIGRLGLVHTIIGILFAGVSSYAVTEKGTVGLVAANCMAMILRTCYSLSFAARYFAKKKNKSVMYILWEQLDQMMPRRSVMFAFASSYFLTRQSLLQFTFQVNSLQATVASKIWFQLALQHIAVGIACGIGVMSLAYVLERDARQLLISMWHGKQD